MDTSSAGADCPNQVSMKTVDRETPLCVLPGVYALVPGADHLCLPFLL